MLILPTRLVAVLALGLATAGCVTDDPRQGGFVGGVVGLSSGTYDQRIAEREQRLANLDAMVDEETRIQEDLQSEQAALEYELQEAKRHHQRLATQLQQLAREVQGRQARSASLEARRAQLIADVDATRRERAALERRLEDGRIGVAEHRREAERLERYTRSLEEASLGILLY